MHTIARPEDVIGRVLSTPMKPGDTFQTTNLFPEGSGPNLSEHLKPGLRAVTVPVDSLGTIGGHVRPGAIVDVLFRATARDDKQGFEEIPEVTVTLFERVEVLAVGPDPLSQRPTTPLGAADRGNPMVNVTLACSPEQSGKLRAVLGHGEIALAMHPEAKAEPPVRDVKQVQDARPVGFTLENILGVDPQPTQAKTEIYRGGNRTTNVFDVRKHRSTLLNVLVDAPQIPPKTNPAPAPPTSVAGPAPVTDQN
jgi:Flp pilus assembly protein CpaB